MFLSSGSTWISLEERSLFFHTIFPELIFTRPAIVLSIVVLPIPDGPSKQIISPWFSIVNDTLLTLFCALAVNVTLSISRKFFVIFLVFKNIFRSN